MSVPPSMLPTVTTLRDPLVKSLGKSAGDTFEKVFGLRTVGDLLRHYPRRYAKRSPGPGRPWRSRPRAW